MDKNTSQWLKDHKAMCIRIIRWVIFGVVVSLLPYWFMLSLYPASDLATSELDSLLDLLLICIAVLANAVNLFWGNEKKISEIFKALSGVILIIVLLYCAYTYGALFDQTIWNNKMLEEYNKLAEPLEGNSNNFSNSSDYEDIMQQLTNIKSIIDKTGTKGEKLKQLRLFSKVVLITVAILGVIVEYFDDRNRRKKRKKGSRPKDDDESNPSKNDGSTKSTCIRDGE